MHLTDLCFFFRSDRYPTLPSAARIASRGEWKKFWGFIDPDGYKIRAWKALIGDSLAIGSNKYAVREILDKPVKAIAPSRVSRGFNRPLEEPTAIVDMRIGELKLTDLAVEHHHISVMIERTSEEKYALYLANTGGSCWIYHPARWNPIKQKCETQSVLKIVDIPGDKLMGVLLAHAKTPENQRSEKTLYREWLPALGGRGAPQSDPRYWGHVQEGGSCVGFSHMRLLKVFLDKPQYQEIKRVLRIEGLAEVCGLIKSGREHLKSAFFFAMEIIEKIRIKEGEDPQLDRLNATLQELAVVHPENLGEPSAVQRLDYAVHAFTHLLALGMYQEARKWLIRSYELAHTQTLDYDQREIRWEILRSTCVTKAQSLDQVDLLVGGSLLLKRLAGDDPLPLSLIDKGHEATLTYLQASVYKWFPNTPWADFRKDECSPFLRDLFLLPEDLEMKITWKPNLPYPVPKDPEDIVSLTRLADAWFRLSLSYGPFTGKLPLSMLSGAHYINAIEHALRSHPTTEEEIFWIRHMADSVISAMLDWTDPKQMNVLVLVMASRLALMGERFPLALREREWKLLEATKVALTESKLLHYHGTLDTALAAVPPS